MLTLAMRHLIWKEYRSQRNLWLVLAVAGLIWQGTAWLLLSPAPSSAPYHIVTAAIVIPLMFVLGTCVLMFAMEKEERTWNLLRTFPLPPSTLFAAKFGCSLVGLAAIFIVAWCPAWMLPDADYPNNMWYAPFAGRGTVWMKWGLLTLAMFVWGCFYSLLTGRALATALLAPLTMLVLAPLPIWFASVVTAIVLGVDYWLTGRWLAVERHATGGRLAVLGRAKAVPKTFLYIGDNAPPWRRSFARLAWLEWRNRKSVFGWLLGLGVVIIFLGSLNAIEMRWMGPGIVLAYLALVPYLMGAWVFHDDQVDRRYRIAANRGLSGESIWFAKQVVWLSGALVVPLLLLLFDAALHFFGKRPYSSLSSDASAWESAAMVVARPNMRHLTDTTEIAAKLLVWVLWAYSCGQFMSLLLRRVITAALVGLIPILAMTIFSALANDLFGLSFAWCAGWLAVALFAATLLRISDWMLERGGWKRWRKILAVIVVPGVLILVLFIIHRMTEIPNIVLQSGPPASLGLSSGAPVERLLHVPGQSFASNIVQGDGRNAQAPSDDPALEPLRQALAKVNPDGTIQGGPNGDLSVYSLADIGVEMTNRGDLDGAFVALVRALRAIETQVGLAEGATWRQSLTTRRNVLESFGTWLVHPQQTAGRVRFALAYLDQELLPSHSLGERMMATYQASVSQLNQDWLMPAEQVRKSSGREEVVWTRRFFPWEKGRMLRLLRVLTLARLSDTLNLEKMTQSQVDDLGAWMNGLRRELGLQFADVAPIDAVAPWKWTGIGSSPIYRYANEMNYLPHLDSMATAIDEECQRRAFLVVCALVLYRLEHGELPARLDDLVPNYLTSVPIDLWRGYEITYQRDGFENPSRHGTGVLTDHRPMVWSAGESGGRVVPSDGRGDSPPAGQPALKNRFDSGAHVDSFNPVLTFTVP